MIHILERAKRARHLRPQKKLRATHSNSTHSPALSPVGLSTTHPASAPWRESLRWRMLLSSSKCETMAGQTGVNGAIGVVDRGFGP